MHNFKYGQSESALGFRVQKAGVAAVSFVLAGSLSMPVSAFANDVPDTQEQASGLSDSLDFSDDEIEKDLEANTEENDSADTPDASDNISVESVSSANVSALSASSASSTSSSASSSATATIETQIMYRLYNPNTGEHLYTADTNEKTTLQKLGWTYEGVGWVAPKKTDTPVYRLYNRASGDHHYTTSTSERDALVKIGWKSEGIGWYSSDTSKVALYRQFNPNSKTGTHNYTTDKNENDTLIKLGWRGEGVAWYAEAAGYEDEEAKKIREEAEKKKYSGDTTLDKYLNAILDSKGRDLRTLFNYVASYRYISGNRSHPSGNWSVAYAKTMYEQQGGTCYNYAALFAWLARAIGYDATAVVGYVPSLSSGWAPHSWVEINVNGTIYCCDPDLAHELPGYNWYWFTYANAPTNYKK